MLDLIQQYWRNYLYTDGYHLTGGTIAFNGGHTIRVGDGTADGANYVAIRHANPPRSPRQITWIRSARWSSTYAQRSCKRLRPKQFFRTLEKIWITGTAPWTSIAPAFRLGTWLG